MQIIKGIFARGGGILTERILDPIVGYDFKNWLWRHQQTHNEMNGILGIQGTDLTTVDFDDQDELNEWLYLHYSEHQQANLILGI